MDTPSTEIEKEEFMEALKNSFGSSSNESVQQTQNRLLMEFYSLGRRHERNKTKGPE